MTLLELAEKIGVIKFELIPQEMYAYYPVPEERRSECCSIEMIERLQEKYEFFGEYFKTVKEYWLATEKNDQIRAYLDAASLFVKDGEYDAIRRTKLIDPKGTPETDLFGLFLHLPTVEQAIADYIKRGFSEEEALKYMSCYRGHIDSNCKGAAGRPMVTRSYVSWLCHYIKSLIFATGGFNFELHTFRNAYVLKNKNSGELAILAPDKTPIHKSGMMLGSAGCEDTDGSFETGFEETDDAYVGFAAKENLFQNQKKSFLKSEWELLMTPTDACIGIHIPRDSDITEGAFKAARDAALALLKERYPDWDPKMFVCGSWLLSPQLEEILKPDSKILGFGRCFTRFPQKDTNGGNARGFVFPGFFSTPAEELPETTSLQRGLKKLLMEGRFVHMFCGVIEL